MSAFKELVDEGMMCLECWVVIDGHAPGKPRRCDDCKEAEKQRNPEPKKD